MSPVSLGCCGFTPAGQIRFRRTSHAEIGGIAVGGLTPAAAEAALRKALEPRLDDNVVLIQGKQRFVLDPEKLGLAPDFAESVRAGGGARSWDPRDMSASEHKSHEQEIAKLEALVDAYKVEVRRLCKAVTKAEEEAAKWRRKAKKLKKRESTVIVDVA